MGKNGADLLQGSLDLLILRVLSSESLHGWGISKRINQLSNGALEVHQGSLYPALYRLRDRGLIDGEWGRSSEGRRAKVYTLTRAGRKAVDQESQEWSAFARAVERVIDATT